MKFYKVKMISLIAIVSALTIGSSSAFANKVIGKLALAKGKVTVTSPSGKSKKARFGTKITVGSVITTEKNSRAKLITIDKNIIHISPESKVDFAEYEIKGSQSKTSAIGLLYGKIRSQVKKQYDGKNSKFQVRTKAAVAGVRGTDFIGSYDPLINEAGFATFEGEVFVGELGPGGEIINGFFISAGEFANATIGQIPSGPRTMPKSEFEGLNESTEFDFGPEEFDESAFDDFGDFDDYDFDEGEFGELPSDLMEAELEAEFADEFFDYYDFEDDEDFDSEFDSDYDDDFFDFEDGDPFEFDFIDDIIQEGTANLIINLTLDPDQ